MTATVNPNAAWRILIKGMGGGGAHGGKNRLTFNSSTRIWSRTTTGIIAYDFDLSGGGHWGTGGPYWVNPIIVPYDPVHQTGGSFWELKEGPNVGWLVSAWSNTLGYGNITVTQDATFNRGPGATLATIYHPNAHLAGASTVYNAPGEMHFTLLVDDPNIHIPIPKQTHYAIEFEATPGVGDWVEVFAGWIWDFDATDTEVVFYGIDYLAALQYVYDERVVMSTTTPPYVKAEVSEPTGSKYVNKTIAYIVSAQLDYAIAKTNSPVGFIARGAIATMTETISGIWSTQKQSLAFIKGLLDSHRAGTGKETRLSVKKIAGVYTFVVEDDPGTKNDALALAYGTLVQGYHVIPFGVNWASRSNMMARDYLGTNLMYDSNSSAIDQATFGNIGAPVAMVDGVHDLNDLKRRNLQNAIDASRFGRQISVGLKLGSYRPFEAFDIGDEVPVAINHGAVDTGSWGSDAFQSESSADPSTVHASYWAILGVTWESFDDGHWMTGLSLYPKGGGVVLPSGVTGVANFWGNANGGPTHFISVLASDDNVTFHEVLASTLNLDVGSNTAIPAGEAIHKYWRIQYHYYDPYGGLHYYGGYDAKAQFLDVNGVDLANGIPFTASVVEGPASPYGTYFLDPVPPGPFGNSFGVGPNVFGSPGWITITYTITLPGILNPLSAANAVIPRVDLIVGNGAPPADNPGNASTYVDRTTGQLYTWDDNTNAWTVSGSPGPTIKNWPLADVLAAGNDANALRIINLLDPVNAQDAATKNYVDVQVAAGTGSMTPYYIAPGETFTVPINKQATYAMTIDNEGILIVDGFLLEVD